MLFLVFHADKRLNNHMALTHDDVGALTYIAAIDKKAFNNRLNLANVDLRWILSGAKGGANTIASLSREQRTSTEISVGDVLIDSPRSTLIIFKNGMTIEQLLPASETAVRRQGLLEGITEQQLAVRLTAEEERRNRRRTFSLEEYEALCEKVDLNSIVDQIAHRDQESLLHREENAAKLRSSPILVKPGRLSTDNVDEVGLTKIQDARSKTAMTLRHQLSLSHRYNQHLIDEERRLRENDLQLMGVAANSNVLRDEQLRQRKEISERKRAIVLERVKHHLQQEERKQDERRHAVAEEQEAMLARAQQTRSLTRHATVASFRGKAERRQQVRETEQAALAERRRSILAAVEERNRVQDELSGCRRRDFERKRLLSQLDSRRRHEQQSVREREARNQRERELQRQDELINERLQTLSEARATRIRAHNEAKQTKKLRGAALLTVVSAAEAERKGSMLQKIQLEQDNLEQLHEQRRQAALLTQERMKQVRLDRLEERARSFAAAEFLYVGYVNDNLHREKQKSEELEGRRAAQQVIHMERDAIRREWSDLTREEERELVAARRDMELRFQAESKRQVAAEIG